LAIGNLKVKLNQMDVLNKRDMKMLQNLDTNKEIVATGGKVLSSAIAATVAETATFPVDFVKTRLQIQGEVAALPRHGAAAIVVKRSMLQTLDNVVQQEGFFNLWSGLRPAICRHMIYTNLRLLVYENTKKHVLHCDTDGSFPFYKAAIGAFAGAVGQLVASPMDLAKVKLQTINQKYVSSPQYKRIPSSCRTMLCILKTEKSVNGYKGLWTGCGPSVTRAALVNIGNLAGYDVTKQWILTSTNLGDKTVCHILASGVAGFATAFLSTPADVIKTRMMNQRRDLNGRGMFYTSSIDCIIKTCRKEGPRAFYKGFVPTWLRIAPWNMLFWITNEYVRNLMGLDSF